MLLVVKIGDRISHKTIKKSQRKTCQTYALVVISAERETGLNIFPEICPFAIAQSLVE